MPTGADLAEAADAIRAWHRGEPLSERQADLVEQARIQCFARAIGADLGPVVFVATPEQQAGQEGI